METKIIPAREGLRAAAALILRGGLVVFPTETVYGLGADAFNSEAVRKIFEAKGRPQDNPLIVHISSVDQVKDIAIEIPGEFYTLAENFMPGPLTIVLKKSAKIPDVVTAGGDTVAVRMPANPYALELISKSRPLAAPSANISKHVSPTTAEHVYDDLRGKVELILDGGACGVGIESTVLDLTASIPTILRPGAVTAEMLSKYVGKMCGKGKIINIAKAPGMKYTHYSPKVETVVAGDIDAAVNEYDRAVSAGLRPIIIARDIYRDKIGNRRIISLGVTAEDYMRNVYSALREAEISSDHIIIEELKGGGIEASVMNRVNKAAGGKKL